MEPGKTADPIADPVRHLGSHWGWMLLYGILLAAIGLIALFEPRNMAGVVAWLFGLGMVLAGIFDLVAAVSADETGSRWGHVLTGIVSLLLGLFILRNTHIAVGVAGLVLGIFWLVRGVVMVVTGVVSRDVPGRGWRIIGGLIFTVLGAYVIGYPSAGAALVIVIMGLLFLVAGLLEIMIAFMAKSAAKEAV
jgi:uncharacterized membrane protein HdeD (DUF308 family)